jgi:hypothetical protein
MSAVYLNTYKVTVEATVQAESEEQARGRIAELLNNNNAIGVGGFVTNSPNTNARIAGLNKVDVKVEEENEQGKEAKTKQEKLNKLAEKQAEELDERGLREVPDEVIVTDPDTGSAVVVKNPLKQKQMEKRQKAAEKGESPKLKEDQQQAEPPKKADYKK